MQEWRHRSQSSMARQGHSCLLSPPGILRATEPTAQEVHLMQYLPLFLLLAAVLIAGYFYVQRAKRRGTGDSSQAATTTPPRSDTEQQP